MYYNVSYTRDLYWVHYYHNFIEVPTQVDSFEVAPKNKSNLPPKKSQANELFYHLLKSPFLKCTLVKNGQKMCVIIVTTKYIDVIPLMVIGLIEIIFSNMNNCREYIN